MAESLWSTTGSSLEETAPTDRRIPRRTSEVSIRLACRALGEPAIAAMVVLVAISPVRAAVPQDEQQKLIAFDAASGDFFGQSVAIDGDTAVVGARRDDDGGSSSGSAYVYTRSGTTWTQQQKLVASDASASAGFGGSVAIDGDTIVIGANGDQGSGSAYVFTRSGTTWTQQQKLTAIEAAATDLFSWSVDVDGDTIAVGNPLDDDGGSGSGSVELFTRAGTVWTRQQELTASDPAADDEFGVSVAVDGDTAIVGAYLDDDVIEDSGSAYVFTRSGTTWTQSQKLTASDPANDAEFGIHVGIDGDTAVVGAYLDDTSVAGSGSAYVFVPSPADLSIVKSANVGVVPVSTSLTYTLTVTNNGPSPAADVSVTDPLPGVVTFVSASAGCSETGGTVTCTTASLANGANIQFTITVTAPGTGQIFSNSASVTSAVADPDSSDNTATAAVTAINPPSVPGLTTWGLGALALGLGALVLVARRRRAAPLR